MTPLYLIIGGSLGTLARYYGATRVGEWAHSNAIGVFAVNIVGAFVIGLFLTLSEERGGFSREARLLVATGFLGAFTTFSYRYMYKIKRASSSRSGRTPPNSGTRGASFGIPPNNKNQLKYARLKPRAQSFV